MTFTKWDKRFIDLTKQIATWSSCLRRNVGAILVKNNRVIATGYNGAPSNVASCKERGYCIREQNHIPHGQNAEMCYASHAEQNAILQCAKNGVSTYDSIMYCTHSPCSVCAKMIINAGISHIIYLEDYPDEFAKELLKEAGVVCHRYVE